MPTFEKRHSHAIPSLRSTIEVYVEPLSGAQHIHVANEHSELAFLVAFPTVPDTSDGRAHILEHLSLAGSKRYPVRDPFFAMMRRSTAPFMNAMTYADRTVYPYASTDRNDFFNLLDVYLDATFFPRLDYLNFLQEGWRHTLADGQLGYQGVVFNEMKGAFSDPMRAMYGGITAALLRGTTYEFVSGGDPLAIPDLTHRMLKDFHATHYHPSQAVFMTAGPIAATEIQERIAQRVLAEIPGVLPRLQPELADVATPRTAVIRVPAQAGRDDDFGFQLAWVTGESADAAVHYETRLLQAGLLGDASAPLARAMETAGFGRPSRLNGMDPGARQMLFHLGMAGLREEQADSARQLLWQALERTAEEGVPHAMLRAALRDIRFGQRDTSSGGMPNVLQRMLQAVPVVMRGGDVHGAFDSDKALGVLEERIADPAYFRNLVRAMLDNPARLEAAIVPDPGYFDARAALEKERLAGRQAALTEAERARIVADSAALDEQQRRRGDTSVLPRIHPSEVSRVTRTLPVVPAAPGGAFLFPVASNGISQARVQYDISALPPADWPWLQLYCELRQGLGVDGRDYQAASAWRKERVPVFAIGLQPSLGAGKPLALELQFLASGLEEDHAGIAEVLTAYVGSPRFDEYERIGFLAARLARSRLTNLAQAGNRYAALAAEAPLSALRRFEDAVGGATALPFTACIDRLAGTGEGRAVLAARLAQVHAALLGCPVSVLCAGSSGELAALAGAIVLPAPAAAAARSPAAPDDAAPLPDTSLAAPLARPLATPLANAALHAPGQVNHCSAAWAVPGPTHPDAAALSVAAQLMTNQLLHTAIREQGGAYGGHASNSPHAGIFSLASYRDPRLAATYADFAAAIEAMATRDFDTEQLEEAIIGVIKGLDRPLSPFDAVGVAWTEHRRGMDAATRQRFRERVLDCTLAEVRAAVDTWLRTAPASRAAFAGNLAQDLDGLVPVDLAQLAGAVGVAA
ncbi:insulinase family protein [Pseudoduganella dura]|uniref:insulinase family protein n=1 Tax=Pseudoduganella dura TaxID=321982 RepID=UPI0016751C9A|nr:insulinase family protein [Pseudoduganella dura]GGY14688.1 peptidase M16 [Pseudoduganella dura]